MKEKTITVPDYSVKFRTIVPDTDEGCVQLEIKYSEDTKKIIRQASLVTDTPVKAKFNLGNDAEQGVAVTTELLRYKVKRIVYSALSDQNKDLLFVKDLADTGVLKLNLVDVRKIDEITTSFRENLGLVIKILTKYSDLETSIKFNLKLENKK